MFTHSAFTENTPEMREWLEMLGYWVFGCRNEKYIYSYTNQYNQGIVIAWTSEDVPEGANDCRNNPALFKAIAALRDDSDYMQWYYSNDWDESNWWLSDRHVVKHKDCIINNVRVWHKATIDELINHFNNK